MLKRLAFSLFAIAAPLVNAQMDQPRDTAVATVAAVAPDVADFVVTETTRYKYAALIHEYAEKFGVDPKLVVSVIRAESNFNPHAVSVAGARGLMQLMPETARMLGVRNSFNPRENIRGGVQHLSYLLERFDGNVKLAVAAYNAGEGAVEKYRGVPPYKETRNYVRVVLAGMR